MSPLSIDIFTLFPEAVEHYCETSILGRAQREGHLIVDAIDIRSGALDIRGTIDDTPFGGGAGMVMKPEPIMRVIEARREAVGDLGPVIALVPHGAKFTQRDAERLSRLDRFALLCGRYEGIDQRVLDSAVDEELSIGDFVVAGGELAALVVIEATARLVPGVLGNAASSLDESFATGLLEYPQWTKPATFEGQRVPHVLLSGDHGRIAAWRRAQALRRTLAVRPDMIEAMGGLSAQDQALLAEVEDPRESD